MRHQDLDKVKTLLAALRPRLQDPTDFAEIMLDLRSGTRASRGRVRLLGTDPPAYCLDAPGLHVEGGADEMEAALLRLLSPMDAARVDFRERGGGWRIEADGRTVRSSRITPDTQPPEGPSRSAGERRYRIRIGEADALLETLGFLDGAGKIRNDRRRKYEQVDHFVERLEPVLEELAATRDEIRVLDCACGKSALSFVLNYHIRERMGTRCRFLGLDLAPGVIRSSREMADALGYRNMTFRVQDLRSWEPDPAFPVDLCMSLHACDAATDYGLHAGIRSGAAAIVCVPCCQRELLRQSYRFPELERGVLRHGVLRARLADILTDAMRFQLLLASGYDPVLIEYVSPVETPKNLMLLARRTGHRDIAAQEEYMALVERLGADIALGRLLGLSDRGKGDWNDADDRGHEQPG